MPILLAAAVLPVGFGVAELTGSRPLGGVVLLLLGTLSARFTLRPLVWAAVLLACFILSHPLGHAIRAWPAVLVVTAVATAAFWRLRR